MGHRQYVRLALDSGDYLLGEGLSYAARAVGDGDEVGIEDGEPIDGPKDGGYARPGPGWVELEGEGALPLQDFGNFYLPPPTRSL
jgi:hypothetical protein